MVNKTAEIDLKILKESCPVCNKVTGSYYEGIIQLRTFSTEFDSRLKDAKDLIVSYVRDLNRDNPNSFISRIENKSNDYDIKSLIENAYKSLSKNFDSESGGESYTNRTGILSRDLNKYGLTETGEEMARFTGEHFLKVQTFCAARVPLHYRISQ